jgi:Restriction endonuclease
MTNYKMNAQPGRYEIQGTAVGMTHLVAAWARLNADLQALRTALAAPGDALAAMVRGDAELRAALRTALAAPGDALAAMMRRDAELRAAVRTAFAASVDLRETVRQPPTGAIGIEGQTPVVEESRAELPELLVPAEIVAIGDSVPEGQLVEAVMLPWFDIINALARDPNFLHQLDWRRMEELIAGAYTRDGWPEVILTPGSRDAGRDIIASKPGLGAIRFYDQVKAYGAGQKVPANDVRAIFGVLKLHQNVSKAVITTTALFAPGVREEFKHVMPYELELRDGPAVREWLLKFLPGSPGPDTS